jgi:hypothetical protein
MSAVIRRWINRSGFFLSGIHFGFSTTTLVLWWIDHLFVVFSV